MTTIANPQFLHFLRDELSLSEASIELALRHGEQDLGLLPIVLWKYGLVTLKQLDKTYDWLASHNVAEAMASLQNFNTSAQAIEGINIEKNSQNEGN
ncbi:DUF2949 domain-containing protein [Nodosilinea sp. LEGE 07088]|uniref:DUF2949 domain-containing protein n=1 Tax=Nodosilinea sp. LEGE 07088 TaxID=2777968 RepID=UPI00187FC9B2|nr:DUF2949 domain-containing protein [Nodosilinea sp. LEGE 07088]MBE9135681.1 DUF2949 domain-containing protein [Nodosilinea sp. LEGE 07088]